MKLSRLLLTRLSIIPSTNSPFRNISHTPCLYNYSRTTTATTPTTTNPTTATTPTTTNPTTATTLATTILKKLWKPKPVNNWKPKSVNGESSLYRRISPLSASQTIVPVLDQWVQEGRDVSYSVSNTIIKELRHYRRYKHALEISQWMNDKQYMNSASDVAIRLDLIAKVHGVDEAESYFNKFPIKSKTLQVYGALLNCFSLANCVEKAEEVMQKMRDLGFASSVLAYNVLLDMYRRTGHREKLDALMDELQAKKIKCDGYTYSILLKFYGSDLDIDGIERILTKMESDTEVNISWMTYATAAKQFLRAELTDKALQVLRKSEKLVAVANKKNEAYIYILTQYANAGEKEDVLRVWKKCKACKATNKNYMSMLRSISKFDDIETAEKILKDWEDSDLDKDFRIPNFLISCYCKTGLMAKAEALIERGKVKNWQKPDTFTRFCMSFGYVMNNQIPKAVAEMESSLLEYPTESSWKPNHKTLVSCLKYLKEEGAAERLNTFIELLKEKSIISSRTHERLLDYHSGNCAIDDVFEHKGLEGMNEYPVIHEQSKWHQVFE